MGINKIKLKGLFEGEWEERGGNSEEENGEKGNFG